MKGLILTGALGAGKTTAQRGLVDNYGFWTPRTVVTRQVLPAETELSQVELEAFRVGVLKGEYVLPARFGGHWYAWVSADFETLCKPSDRCAVLNVRPYTALVLSTIFRELTPVWLSIDEGERARRLSARAQVRDVEQAQFTERAHSDAEESDYEPLFHYRVLSGPGLIEALLSVLGERTHRDGC